MWIIIVGIAILETGEIPYNRNHDKFNEEEFEILKSIFFFRTTNKSKFMIYSFSLKVNFFFDNCDLNIIE